MTGEEHYREAERLLVQASIVDEASGQRYFLADTGEDIAAAQVHATLALAAGVAEFVDRWRATS